MAALPTSRFAPALAELARPADLRALSLPVLHVVMAMRLAALFDRAGRDPLVEMTTRLASITAAEQLLALVRLVARSWPEPYMAGRPCCLHMTPDERTLAGMVRAAAKADRAGFGRQIDGFVRADRHEPLFQQTVLAVASLAQPQDRG